MLLPLQTKALVALQCKELIHKARLSSEPYQEELEPFVNLFDTKDQKEGVEAFLDKRKPNWQNA